MAVQELLDSNQTIPSQGNISPASKPGSVKWVSSLAHNDEQTGTQ